MIIGEFPAPSSELIQREISALTSLLPAPRTMSSSVTGNTGEKEREEDGRPHSRLSHSSQSSRHHHSPPPHSTHHNDHHRSVPSPSLSPSKKNHHHHHHNHPRIHGPTAPTNVSNSNSASKGSGSGGRRNRERSVSDEEQERGRDKGRGHRDKRDEVVGRNGKEREHQSHGALDGASVSR